MMYIYIHTVYTYTQCRFNKSGKLVTTYGDFVEYLMEKYSPNPNTGTNTGTGIDDDGIQAVEMDFEVGVGVGFISIYMWYGH